jgi:tetratricopeptide (TPR) repeat protein
VGDGVAENLLKGLAGKDPPDEIVGGDAEITPPDAVATTLALKDRLGKVKGDKIDQEAINYFRDQREVLHRQAKMLELQMEHLHEQRTLNIRHMRIRNWRETMQLSLQIFLAVAATVIGIGAVVMLFDAFNSRSVVVEPFDAPPSLAQRGVTGKAVAVGVLDQLVRLQSATRSAAEKRHLSNAWTGDIKIEVPETGISIGELDRILKERLGHNLHIDGGLTQTADGGLALTVRGDGVLPRTFTGGADDLDVLSTQAAEYIYGQAEPSLYAAYLLNNGRNADALAFSKVAFSGASAEERPRLLIDWGNALLNIGAAPREALGFYQAALKLKPDYWTAYNNVMNTEWLMGDEESAWRAGEEMRKVAGGRPRSGVSEFNYQNWDTLTWNLLPWRKEIVADAEANGGMGTATTTAAPGIADIDQRLHDNADAELQLATSRWDPNDPTISAMTHFVHGRLAAEAGDVTRAAAEMEAFGKDYENPVVSTNYPGYDCWIAPAEEAAGHPDLADAALNKAGHFVDCYRFKADILDHRGDWPAAQQAYGAAVALAPDLPAAWYSWGQALARHGDLEGAKQKFAAANKRGPHWADPLKAWGDVLARQGKWGEALSKYDEALQYAPAWRELKEARAVAQKKG